MNMLRLVYVSSLIDEYGFALPSLMALLNRDHEEAHGHGHVESLTLFANGNVMQMLEGQATQVRTVFAHLHAEPVHFGITVLVDTPITRASIQGTHIGLLQFAQEIGKSMHPTVHVFKLSPQEIDLRVQNCDALALFMEFAAGYRCSLA